MAQRRVDSFLLARSRTYSSSMSIYLRQDEVQPGALVKTMSRDNEIVPALVLSFAASDSAWGEASTTKFVRVLSVDGETYVMNALYLEHWK